MAVKDSAIVLRRSDYSETSLVLRVMTRGHGQVSLMAKGVKRPKNRFGGSIDLLAVGEAVFTLPRAHSVSTMGTLTGWDLTAHFPLLRTDLLRNATAQFAAELLTRLTEELDPHPAAFDAMARLLAQLDAGEPPLRRLAEFARTLLADVGLSPSMERCVQTGRPIPEGADKLLFSGTRGGVIVPPARPASDESTVRVSPQLCAFFARGGAISGKLALEITRWLIYHVQNQIGRELRSAPALERAVQAALAQLRSRS